MAIDWKVAGSLDQLLDQLDDLAPDRSTLSDGGIGDPDHASRSSDHNPWLVIGRQHYVSARDFTHDPDGGLDAHLLADSLQEGRDQRVKYVIWDRRIMAGDNGPQPWVWRPYNGDNAHTKHLHLSVVADLRATLRIPWVLPLLDTAPNPTWPEADMPSAREVADAILDTPIKRHGDGIDPNLRGGTTTLRNEIGWLTNSFTNGPWWAPGAGAQVARQVDQLAAAGSATPDELRALRSAIEQLIAPVDNGPGAEAGPQLGADEVRTLIREALADLGPLHLTTKENV